MTDADRAQKAVSLAAIDLWESRFWCPGSAKRARRAAKRMSRKARRRIDRFVAMERE